MQRARARLLDVPRRAEAGLMVRRAESAPHEPGVRATSGGGAKGRERRFLQCCRCRRTRRHRGCFLLLCRDRFARRRFYPWVARGGTNGHRQRRCLHMAEARLGTALAALAGRGPATGATPRHEHGGDEAGEYEGIRVV